MKKIANQILYNLKKEKTSFISFGVIILITALILNCAAVLLCQVDRAYDTKFEKLSTAMLNAIVPEVQNSSELEKAIDEIEKVEKIESYTAIMTEATVKDFNGADFSMNTVFYNIDDKRTLNNYELVSESKNNVDDPIYIPLYVSNFGGFALNDEIVYAIDGKAYIYSLKYASNYDTSCLIKKYRIVKNAEDEIVRTSERGNPYMGIEIPEFCEYDGTEVSGVSFNKKGEITRIWSNELTKEEEEIVSSYRPERFEFPFIKIPFDMPVGSIVKEVTTGTYGVLSQGKKDWDDYLKRIEDRKWYVDFSDIQVMVYELTESGCWSHNHMNPLYLQLEEPEHIPGDEENQTFISAMKAFGNYLQSEDEEKVMKGQAVMQWEQGKILQSSESRSIYL